jgi:hypothetical protein
LEAEATEEGVDTVAEAETFQMALGSLQDFLFRIRHPAMPHDTLLRFGVWDCTRFMVILDPAMVSPGKLTCTLEFRVIAT